mgnify:CR=1 FL=1
MSQEWIIDVLADLRQYAIRNYYVGLAEQLDDAIVTAAVEIRAAKREAPAPAAPATREADAALTLSG